MKQVRGARRGRIVQIHADLIFKLAMLVGWSQVVESKKSRSVLLFVTRGQYAATVECAPRQLKMPENQIESIREVLFVWDPHEISPPCPQYGRRV